MKIGFAFCGSFCNHPELLKLYEDIARKFIVTSQKRQEIPAFFRFTAKSAEFVFPPAPLRPSG